MRTDTTEALVWQVAHGTDAGQRRTNNEDTCYVSSNSETVCLFGIFDGMGGMVAGEEASRIAAEQFATFFTPERRQLLDTTDDPAVVPELLHEALRVADAAIRDFAETTHISRIGTTAVVAVCAAEQFYLANLGDSRGYLLRDGEPLTRLSQDHTVAAMLLELGEITEEEARESGMRNQLLASLGNLGQNKPHFRRVAPVYAGDRFLLCSDGLWDMITEREIEAILTEAVTPDQAVEQLITAANAAGGNDNISVIAIFLQGD